MVSRKQLLKADQIVNFVPRLGLDLGAGLARRLSPSIGDVIQGDQPDSPAALERRKNGNIATVGKTTINVSHAENAGKVGGALAGYGLQNSLAYTIPVIILGYEVGGVVGGIASAATSITSPALALYKWAIER
jgi:hypothetical protein